MMEDLVLSRRYRLLERLAAGGMGEVWRATDELLARPVAVKLLRQEHVSDETARIRFQAEARFAAALQHGGIAQVYDYGEQDERAYLVMELVPGEPLSKVLRRDGPLDADVTLDLIGQAARALQVAHTAGIIHRDVKPANLMVTDDGTLKITDFGIARGLDVATVTQTGMVMGTAHYISPEQASGKRITPATDLYSLGVVGFECLIGHPPFEADSPVAIALKHVRETPPALPPGVPDAVRELILSMLAKDPAERPVSAWEVAERSFVIRDTSELMVTGSGGLSDEAGSYDESDLYGPYAENGAYDGSYGDDGAYGGSYGDAGAYGGSYDGAGAYGAGAYDDGAYAHDGAGPYEGGGPYGRDGSYEGTRRDGSPGAAGSTLSGPAGLGEYEDPGGLEEAGAGRAAGPGRHARLRGRRAAAAAAETAALPAAAPEAAASDEADELGKDGGRPAGHLATGSGTDTLATGEATWRRRPALLLGAVVAGVLLLGAIVAFSLVRGGSDSADLVRDRNGPPPAVGDPSRTEQPMIPGPGESVRPTDRTTSPSSEPVTRPTTTSPTIRTSPTEEPTTSPSPTRTPTRPNPTPTKTTPKPTDSDPPRGTSRGLGSDD